MHAAKKYIVRKEASMEYQIEDAERSEGSRILVTLMVEALSSSEMSVLKRATWHNTPEDTILQNLSLSFEKDVF
jgi:hypothetical protein